MIVKNNNTPVYLNNDVHNGHLCLTGTNIPLFVIFEYLSSGYSVSDIAKKLPTISKKEIFSVLKYTAEQIDHLQGDKYVSK